MPFKIKICGMRDSKNIAAIAAMQPDYLGFIFYPKSKRYVGNSLDENQLLELPESIEKVGVFVNADFIEILKLSNEYGFNLAQLHGEETPELCAELQEMDVQVIKVFSVGADFDFQKLKPYLDCTDYFLFDTKGKERGGNGITFNWEILQQYPFDKPFFLSGGIDLNNLKELEKLTNLPLHAIDVNSKFETEPALKEVAKVEKLLKFKL